MIKKIKNWSKTIQDLNSKKQFILIYFYLKTKKKQKIILKIWIK
jgi:hypothetical protein